ncbi:F0F1 ATP synthase subunit delta [Candidatus Gottesmanbacteria bacterium]|nr:F0F1 ATP synthase subunit delta [Candidatus Gottesmanbacteria bacterium]
MKQVSTKSKALVSGLLDYIFDEGEQYLLPQVTKSLEKEVARIHKSDEIVVSSMVKLSPGQLKKIKETLHKMLNVKYPLVNEVDKNLIGGFTIKVNDWFFDASISHEIELLERSLLV